MSDRRIAIHADAGAARVDRFVAERTELSRSAITRLARDGRVRIAGRSVEAGHKVRAGDEIEVDVPEEAPPPSLLAEDIAVEVLYQDGDVIVVNKPAGLVVHPAHGHAAGTLVNALVSRIAGEEGRAAGRPGIVHRLDKDTSGVMIVARNDVAQVALARQLQGRTVRKEYLALVWGDPGPEPAVIDAPLLRDPGDRRRMIVRVAGRESVTRFKRAASYGSGNDRRALLHVQPLTGRTHQIRAHLAFARTPIVGDPVYGRRNDPSGLGRQFLHAWRLTVRLPHAGERTFTAPLAPDLVAYLAVLGAPRETAEPYGEVA
ncbi:MAG: RluA family pseudouridine synthase [Candidatus Limnocylindria bacterium]